MVWTWILIALLCLVLTVGASSAEDKAEPAPRLSVALLQMQWPGDEADCTTKAEEFCRKAAGLGADVALMPEMWNIGYNGFDGKADGAREAWYKKAVPKDGPYVRHFAKLAEELDMAIAVTYSQAWSGPPRNAVTLFDRHGKEVYTYAKVHTCDFAAMERSMTPGTEFYVGDLDTKSGPVKVGSMICYDREQPESARILMLKGAEIILTPNACGLDDMRLDQFKVRAWENVVGVAMTNYPKPANNGRSCAFDTAGKCLVMAGEVEGIFIAEFDLAELRQARARSIWGNAYRRPQRYGILSSLDKDGVWNRTDGNGEAWSADGR